MSYNSASGNLQLIVSLCESLSKKGITPSVGLIKKHANRSLPLPEIISVLRNWKQDPNHYSNTDAVVMDPIESQIKNSDEIVESLQLRVDKLEQQMATLLKSLG